MTAARNCSVTLDKNELQLWDGMERMMLYFALGERWLANCNPHMNVGCALHCLDMLWKMNPWVFAAVQSVSPWLALVPEASRQLCSIHVMIFSNFVLHL